MLKPHVGLGVQESRVRELTSLCIRGRHFMPGGSQKFARKFWAHFNREFYRSACLQQDETVAKDCHRNSLRIHSQCGPRGCFLIGNTPSKPVRVIACTPAGAKRVSQVTSTSAIYLINLACACESFVQQMQVKNLAGIV